MAEQIDELFVKLGLDTDEKEFQQANEQFANLRTNALQFGAALGTVGAAGFGLVSNFASRTDELGQFADRMGVSAQFVNQLGFALESVGGSADDAMPSIENMLSVLQDQDWGQLEGKIESLSAGIDFEELKAAATEADSLREAYVNISDQIQGLDDEKQRRVLKELGIEGEQMNLMKLGPQELRARFQRGSELAPVSDEMTENAREFERTVAELKRQTQGIADILGNRLAPAITQVMEAIVDPERRTNFEQGYENAIDFFSRGPIQALSELYQGNFGAAGQGIMNTATGTGSAAWEAGTMIPNFMWGMMGNWTGMQSEGNPEDAERPGPDSFPLSPRRGGGDFMDARPDTSMNTGGGNQLNFNIDARGATDPEGVALNVERAVNRTLSRYAENAILDLAGGVS